MYLIRKQQNMKRQEEDHDGIIRDRCGIAQ